MKPGRFLHREPLQGLEETFEFWPEDFLEDRLDPIRFKVESPELTEPLFPLPVKNRPGPYEIGLLPLLSLKSPRESDRGRSSGLLEITESVCTIMIESGASLTRS